MPPYLNNFNNFNNQRSHDKIDLRYYTLIEFARKIANKLDYELINYIDSGSYGAAFKISKFRVLKLTTDVSEVYTAKMLIDKKPEHIVNYYDVKKIECIYLDTDLWVLIMDYVFSVRDGDPKNKLFFEFFNFNFGEKEDFYKNIFNEDYIQQFIEKYKNYSKENSISDSKISKNFQELKKLSIEADDLGIYPLDVHSGNLGYKFVDTNLVYFDVGVNKNYKIVPIEKIIIN